MCAHVIVRDVKWGKAMCPVKGGGCVSKLSFNRGFSVQKVHCTCVKCMYRVSPIDVH